MGALRRKSKNSKRAAEYLHRLEQVLAKPENQYCADCDEKSTAWASILMPLPGGSSRKMGIICCYKCCNYHFLLGRDVCQVKNMKKADDWSDEEIKILEAGGNDISNVIYEGNLTIVKPSPTNHLEYEQFIESKYLNLEYFCMKTYEAHHGFWFSSYYREKMQQLQEDMMGTAFTNNVVNVQAANKGAAIAAYPAVVSKARDDEGSDSSGKTMADSESSLGDSATWGALTVSKLTLSGAGTEEESSMSNSMEDLLLEVSLGNSKMDDSFRTQLSSRSAHHRSSRLGRRTSLGGAMQERSVRQERRSSLGVAASSLYSQDNKTLSPRTEDRPASRRPSADNRASTRPMHSQSEHISSSRRRSVSRPARDRSSSRSRAASSLAKESLHDRSNRREKRSSLGVSSSPATAGEDLGECNHSKSPSTRRSGRRQYSGRPMRTQSEHGRASRRRVSRSRSSVRPTKASPAGQTPQRQRTAYARLESGQGPSSSQRRTRSITSTTHNGKDTSQTKRLSTIGRQSKSVRGRRSNEGGIRGGESALNNVCRGQSNHARSSTSSLRQAVRTISTDSGLNSSIADHYRN